VYVCWGKENAHAVTKKFWQLFGTARQIGESFISARAAVSKITLESWVGSYCVPCRVEIFGPSDAKNWIRPSGHAADAMSTALPGKLNLRRTLLR
jgi:hypothetical protein